MVLLESPRHRYESSHHFPPARHRIASFRRDGAVLCGHPEEMRTIRFRWWLPVILAVFGLGYLVFRDDAPDITEDLRARVKSAPGSMFRVIYLEDVARDFLSSNWSIACVVRPYAISGDEVPEALRRAWWVGNRNEGKWRIALLDDRRVLRSFSVRYPLQFVDLHPSGIKCVPRENNPVLRISQQLSGSRLVQLGAGDARPGQ